ncbi:MAG TPA: DNA-binding domain-containing protein [Hyphomicrobiaceae bacterium]|nr:DNA-binding domain-containing protein [Hyphomicrobiaceae bacterium]
MPLLAETQARLARAMLSGDASAAVPLLSGGERSAGRLAIHLRHYEASLMAALAAKFPACAWLLGERFFAETTRRFVHRQPPTKPCMAEYGAEFPRFLAQQPASAAMPYLRGFAVLEWHLGQVSIAIDHPPLALSALRPFAGEALYGLTLRLQPGIAHLRSRWPIDELMRLYLSANAPDSYLMNEHQVCLEVRGARGVFTMDRLDPATFAFRSAIAAGRAIGAAAEAALEADAAFDPGGALARLYAERLVVAVNRGA